MNRFTGTLALCAVFVFATTLSWGQTITSTQTDTFTPNGAGRVTPGNNVTYSIQINNTGGTNANGVTLTNPTPANTALVAGSLRTTCLAINDTYTALGNVPITIAAGSGVLTNDTDPDALGGGTLSATAITGGATLQGGTVTLSTNGGFTYTPPAGFTGADTFTYTLNDNDDAPSTDTATVTVNVSGMIWFIDENQTSNGDGRLNTPFNNLASFQAINAVGTGNNPKDGQAIFLYESGDTYAGGIVLRAGQRLIGQDATSDLATLAGVTPPSGSAALPTMNSGNATVARVVNAGGNGVTMGLNSHIHGFTAGNASGFAVSGTSAGTIQVSGVTINTTGAGLFLDTVTFGSGSSFSSITSAGGSSGISLAAVSGTATLGGGALSGHSSNSFALNGGTGDVSYTGSVTKNSGTGSGVFVTSRTGGTVTLSGAISVSTASGVTGVNLTNNTGATINLSGGLNLNTGTGSAFVATGGGTVTVTGSTNQLVTTTASALNVSNTNIGAAGLTFRSITSTGGSDNGIILSSTGTSAGLTVTGDGAGTILGGNTTGGTIGAKSGADGSATQGSGIYLSNTRNVVLSHMVINGTKENFGIRGASVVNFSLNSCTVAGTNGNNDGQDEGSVIFTELTGSATVNACLISGSVEHNMSVINSSGSLNRITVTGSTFGAMNNTTGSDGLLIEGSGTAVINATVTNNFFNYAIGDHFQYSNNTAAQNGDVVFTGNSISNTGVTAVSGGGGVRVVGGSNVGGLNGGVTFNLSNNSMRDSRGTALAVNKLGGTGNWSGSITNNAIGVAGVNGSGSAEGSAIFSLCDGPAGSTYTALISGNTVRQYGNYGIFLQTGGSGVVGGATANWTLTNNIASNPSTFVFAKNGVHLNGGVSIGDTYQISLNLGGTGVFNSFTGSGTDGGTDFRLRQRQSTTVSLPGYGGTATDTAAVVAYVQGRNTGGATGSAAVNSPPGGGFINGPSTPLPLLFAEGLSGMDVPQAEMASAASLAPAAVPAGTATPQSPLFPATTESDAVSPSLSESQLDALVAEAISRWEATGLSDEQREALRSLDIGIGELDALHLGHARGDRIEISRTAAGNEWFIDPTPGDDTEFGRPSAPTRLTALGDGGAKDRVDLLTVLMHEMGHRIGLFDRYDERDRDRVMYGFLGKDERRVPAKGDASGAAPWTDANPRYLGSPLAIGTLPPGKSITVTFQVTVNTSPTTFTSVSSQGTVSGSNFTSVSTDDPDVAGAANATITPVEQLPTVTAIAKSTNEDTTMGFTAANFDAGFGDVNAGDTLQTLRITSLPGTGLLQNNGVTILPGNLPVDIARANIPLLTFVPATDVNGATSFSWTASDGNGFATATALVNITINAINDEPDLDVIPNPTAIPEDSGQQTVNLTGIGEGAANESAQNLTITASSDNVGLIPNPVTVNYTEGQTTGSVTYTPVANAFGTATITVTVQDSGGAPGDDTITRQFNVVVNPVADTPSITNATTLPNTQTSSGLVVSRNAADGAEVTHYQITNIQNGSLFQNNGTTAIAANSFITHAEASAGLKFTPSLNFQGDATFQIQASTSNVVGGLGGNVVTATISVSERVSIDTPNAGDNDAAEGGVNNGIFTFTRGGSAGVLVANFQLHGSSTASAADFSLTVVGSGSVSFAGSSGTVSFPDTVTTVTVALTALAETPNAAEAAETVRFDVVPIPGTYLAGTPGNATVSIAQNGFLVTTTNDGGEGSLRQAIENANGLAGTDTVTFDITGTGPHTILLGSALPALDSNLNIQGPLAERIIVDGNNANRLFAVNAGRIVNLSRLTLTKGSASGNGGAILNSGTLTVVSSTLSGNVAVGTGGAIHNDTSAALTVVSSTLANNVSNGGGSGLWINNNGIAQIVNSTISGNTTPESGGGIIVFTGANATILNSTITNNRSNTGGGGGPSGGIGNFGAVTIHNSIVAGNFNGAGTTAGDFLNTAANPASSNNLIGTGGSGGLTNGTNGNQVGVSDALLGTLQDNGGPTSTHALLAGSPALNAGSNALLPADTLDLDGDTNTTEPIPFDQRGPGFIRAIGTVDIGAFELQKSVSITALDAVKNEGNSGTTNFTFTVARTGDTTGDVTTTYTVGGAGVSGTDFTGGTLPTGTATITNGNTSTTVTIPVSGDTVREANEAFTVTLSGPDNGYVVSGAPASGTINNDDFEADLSITKTDGVTTAVPGASVTYTITASNAGPDPATATVADTFPASLTATWTAVGAGGGTVAAAGSGNINELVTLPSGGSVTFTVSATIAPSATGTLSNTATVAIGPGASDPNAANNSATDTDTLTPQADLSITKTDGVTTATPGGSVTYTITVSNAGPSNAPGTTVADTLPAALTGTWTGVGAGGGTGTASGSGNINDTVNLPVGGSFTYTVSATISPAATGNLSNTATTATTGAVTDPNLGNNSATDTDTLNPQADLSITKTDGVTTATPGESVTYTITASNAGPSDTTAKVADTFPAIFTGNWTAVGAGGGTATASGSGNINDSVSLPAGGSVTYTVTGSISPAATGTMSNTATVAGVATDPVPGNNSATDTDNLVPQADLSITKTDGVTTVTPGGGVIYTITASNAGPSNVTGATVVDTLPASLGGATWSTVGAGGGTATSSGAGNINDTVNLPVGGSVTYTVMTTLDPAASGTLSNTATVSSGVTDPVPANNSATDADNINTVVSITATDADADEITPATATWRVSRTGTSGALLVNLLIDATGTATAADWTQTGATFATSEPGDSGTVTIPDGQGFVDIVLTPVDELVAETDETVILEVTSSSAYVIGSVPAVNRTVTIARNDFGVTNTNDSGEGSLRLAVENGNVFGGNPTITFEGPVFSDATADTITLGGTQIPISVAMTLEGPGADLLSISGGGLSRIFSVDGNPGVVTLRGVSLVAGRAVGAGDDGAGAAISFRFGNRLVIEGCRIADNTSDSWAGAINKYDGILEIRDSTFSGNVANSTGTGGGAIFNVLGDLVIVNSTFSGNSAPNATPGNGGGGAILNYPAGVLVLSHSTVTGNRVGAGASGGGIDVWGNETITHSIIAGNFVGTGTTPSDIGTFGTQIETATHNLIGDAATAGGITDGTSGNLVGDAGTGTIDIATVLDTILADNGGPTPTHKLVAGGPAVDAGDPAFDGSVFAPVMDFDQRGVGFARVEKGLLASAAAVVDLGAFELIAAPVFTNSDLSLSVDDEPINLATATGVSPTGGVFSGPGVSGGFFDPRTQVPGTYTLTYTVTDAFGVSNSSDFTVTVVALPPSLTLTQPKRFKATVVGTSSRSQRVYIRNVGGLPTKTLRIGVSGPAKKDFIVTQPAARSLEAGESTFFQVTFRPRDEGNRKALVTVYSDSTPVSVKLQGRGQAKSGVRPPRAVK